MTVETASYISQLDTTLPTAADLISEGDDHLRLTKAVLKTQFPNFGTTAVAASSAELNYSVGVTSGIQAQLNAKAPAASPTFTGTAVLPETTSIGTVSDVEIARLGGVTSSIQTQINGKGAITGQAWTGAHRFAGATSVPTLVAGSNTTGAASTAFVQADFLQKFPNYTAPVNASTTELNYLVGLTGAIQPQLSNQVSGPIHAATTKPTPADADELGITDSAASWGLKKLTFANLKTWLGGLFVSKSGDTMSGNLIVDRDLWADLAVRAYGLGGDGATMHGYYARGSKESPTAVLANDPIWGIGARPHTGVDWAEHSTGAIHFYARENISPTAQGTSARITVAALGATWVNRIHAVQFECDGIGQGARWRAKFSGATQASRTFVQDDSGNATSFGVLSGADSASSATMNLFSRRDPDNSPYLQVSMNETITAARVYSGALGTAAALPLVMATDSVALTLSAVGGTALFSGAFGYGTGSGGTVTQATSKSTTVTLNKPSGLITMSNAALAANTAVTFAVNNSAIAAGDTVSVNLIGGVASGVSYITEAQGPSAGVFYIVLRNMSGGALSEAVQIQFNVHKGARS